MTQRLVTDEHGRAVLLKSAPPGPRAERLRREAALLRAAAHPGVVELLDERTGEDGGVELVLAVAGSRTIADLRTDLRGVADVVAALAATVADLHDLGLVHGRIGTDHVVIDSTGRPVLCGLAEAGPSIDGRRPTDDVHALGVLLGHLVEPRTSGVDVAWEPIPERRFGRVERWQGYAKRALLIVVDQATAEDPTRRPSARALAAAILAARPEPRRAGLLPHDLVGVARAATTPLAAALGLGLLVFGVGSLLRPTDGLRSDTPTATTLPAASAPSAPSPSPQPSADLDAPPADVLRPLECPEVAEPAADPDGDGCPSTVTVGDALVEVDGVRYGVGRPGDLLAVGDWDCDGAATVALVRAGSGEVFVFDGWADRAASESVASTATVPRAAAVEAVDDDRDGCPELVVVDDRGGRTEVAA